MVLNFFAISLMVDLTSHERDCSPDLPFLLQLLNAFLLVSLVQLKLIIIFLHRERCR